MFMVSGGGFKVGLTGGDLGDVRGEEVACFLCDLYCGGNEDGEEEKELLRSEGGGEKEDEEKCEGMGYGRDQLLGIDSVPHWARIPYITQGEKRGQKGKEGGTKRAQ